MCFYYRDLQTSVQIPAELLPGIQDGGDIRCLVLITETLPSGAYVDKFQLQAQQASNGLKVCVIFFPFTGIFFLIFY